MFITEDCGKVINKAKIIFLMPLLFQEQANQGINPFLLPVELSQTFPFSVHTEQYFRVDGNETFLC
jgi:hypothetical protein